MNYQLIISPTTNRWPGLQGKEKKKKKKGGQEGRECKPVLRNEMGVEVKIWTKTLKMITFLKSDCICDSWGECDEDGDRLLRWRGSRQLARTRVTKSTITTHILHNALPHTDVRYKGRTSATEEEGITISRPRLQSVERGRGCLYTLNNQKWWIRM